MDRKKTTIYLTQEDERMLDALTRGGEVSRAHVIRESIARYYAELPDDMPTVGLFEDDELHSTDLDAYFKANWSPE